MAAAAPQDPTAPARPEPAAGIAPAEVALLASVLVVAACGLVYELFAAAPAIGS